MSDFAVILGFGLCAAGACLTVLWGMQVRLMLDRMRELERRIENHRRYLDLLQKHRDCQPEEWLE